MTAPRRVFVVGTDTGVGKTRASAAIVRALWARGVRTLVYKPAISGTPGPKDDLEILRAAMPSPPTRAQIHSFAYRPPLAPGVAESPRSFTHLEPPPRCADEVFAVARTQLGNLESHYDAQLSIIEGAGGLRVPMPGGTWLDAWIPALRARPLVVGRLGLGTLNHTLLTFEALRARELEPLGFVLSTTHAQPDPSCADNLKIIQRQSGVPCFGVLPFHEDPAAPVPAWFDADAFLRAVGEAPPR